MKAVIMAVTRMDTPEQLSMQFAKFTSLAAGVALCGTLLSLKTGDQSTTAPEATHFIFVING